MSEMSTFENRLAARLRDYSAPAAHPPTAGAVARAVAAAREQRGSRLARRWPTIRRGPRLWIMVGALLVLGLIGGALAGSQLQRQDQASHELVPTTDGGALLSQGRWTTGAHMPVELRFEIPAPARAESDRVRWSAAPGPNSIVLLAEVERGTTLGGSIWRPLAALHVHSIDAVYADPCGPELVELAPGTLQEFGAWVVGHPNVRLPYPPADTSIAGRPAKEFRSLELSCPGGMPDPSLYWLWHPARVSRIEFGAMERFYVAEVGDTLVAVGQANWRYDYAPTPGQHAEIETVFGSFRLNSVSSRSVRRPAVISGILALPARESGR